jgi:hypothetical protein
MFNERPLYHTIHVNPVFQFILNLLYHVSVNGWQDNHSAFLQFLKVLWKKWYNHMVLDIPPTEETTLCDVWGLE